MSEENKRLYYTDPIKAAYMAKEFKALFCRYCNDDQESAIYIYEVCECVEIKDWGYEENIYVHPLSFHIFEPKEGDEGRIKTRLGASYARYNLRQWVGRGLNQEEEPAIIIRDNKQFFMPEEE